MRKQLIINVDDFGATREVNSAVAKSRRHGILTSASLMVGGDAFQEAMAIARRDPNLAVGLHLTLSDGRPVSRPSDVSRIVCRDSRLCENPVLAALRYHFDTRAQNEIKAELEQQFQRFADTRIPLSHVDGHQNMHAHPAILPTVVNLAVQYGARGIRVPRDPFWANMRANRSRPAAKTGMALALAYLARVCAKCLKDSDLAVCDISIGCLMSGRMSSEYVIGMLKSISCGATEIYFHPSDLPTGISGDAWGQNPGDLMALTDPDLRDFITGNNFVLTTYPEIKRQPGEDI